MKKRAISLLLTLCMVFTMVSPAVAVEPISAVNDPPAITQETTSVPEEPSVPEDTAAPETPAAPEDGTVSEEPTTSEDSTVPEDTTASEDAAVVEDPAAEDSSASENEAEEPAVPETTAAPVATVPPQPAPTIPGYTLVTSTTLGTNQYYLIVAVDSAGNAYSIYPDAKQASAGATILDQYAANGTFVAKLNLTENSVTAKREITGNPDVAVDDLRFTIEKTAGGVTFKNVNNLYLNVASSMFSNTATPFSMTMNQNNSFVLKNAQGRILDFNKSGDPNEFVGTTKCNTNFWGPSGVTNTRLPIYLYTQNDNPVNPDAPDVVLGERMPEMFDKQATNNTWMFDGGVVTQGSVKDIKGARSYVYQFEEYIRWTQASVREEWCTRQRFVFNVGKAGQTLADSLNKFDDRAAKLKPRAAAYLIGKEDCNAGAAGVETFKANLKTYIEKALQLRDNTGFAVIQTPYPSVENGKLYTDAAIEVINALDQESAARVQLVDHFNATNWNSSYVNNRGNLTDRGHLELGRLLSEVVYGSSVNYPATTVPANFPQLSYADTPSQYTDTPATVTAGANSLNVVLPSGISAVNYELKTDAYTLTGSAADRSFTISDLPANASYTLTLTSTDGQTRLPVMVGTVKDGVAATQHTNTVNPQIAKLMDSKKPMTWMFMGDSITHGAFHTCGYDSISQLFEKFLRDDLGRTDDLVLNTAVSSAATADTVQYLEERLNKYQPDVVFLMLGANCVGERGAYKTNLTQIVTAAQAKGAIVVLRTPVCKSDSTSAFASQAEMMRQVAKETNAILVEQNSIWGAELKDHPYLSGKLFNNALHPNAIGHIWMFRMLLEGIGLDKDDSLLYNLSYDLGTTTSNNTAFKPYIAVENNTATLDTAKLSQSTSLTFSEVTLTAKDAASGLSCSVTVDGGTPAVLNNLPAGKTFTYEISAQEKSRNNIVTFTGTTDPNTNVDALEIPGYTRVTTNKLDPSKYYLVVGKDSSNNLFAMYPAEAGLTASAGNAINSSAAPNGAFVAPLNIKDNAVTATLLENNQAIGMDALHFTVTKSGSKYAFAGSNGNYLSLGDYLLSSSATNLSVTMRADGSVHIKNDNNGRLLDFNKNGDPNEFKNHGTSFNTNFWAPYGSTKFSVYLYELNDTVVPPTVNKAELKHAISRADDMMASPLYTEESKSALDSALKAAKAEDANQKSTVDSVAKATQDLIHAMQAMTPIASMIADGAPADGTTEGQPFPKGTGTSQTFRIPAITTLNDNSVAAAIDARWDACPDGYGIDTLFSISTDNGKTWNYTYPNFFNDSINVYHKQAASFIDPVMVQGNDGTIYLMTDVFPGGHYIGNVDRATGYVDIGGEQRMVLYTTRGGQNNSNYTYYVGEFETAQGDSKAFAPVIDKNDANHIAYYVDDHYYLYTVDKAPMYCQQLGSEKYVQQNVFFYNADLHVRNATYLWLITSKDNGETWSAPTILNPQVRPAHDKSVHRFYGVGPGAGLALDDGTVMLPCYTNTPEKSSFVYTRDNGKTWHRSDDATIGGDWSSESALVQIDATTVRQFCRDGHGVLRYTDHVWNASSERWERDGQPVRLDNVVKTSANQISAIRYSEMINGKPVILVSTAATGSNARQNGKIYAFNLNENKTMTLLSSYEVTKPGVTYGYSSLTELEDGSIGLLYEDTFIHGTYLNIPLNKIIPGAIVNGERSYYVPMFGTCEFPFDPVPTEEALSTLDPSIVSAEIKGNKVAFTGLNVGSTSFVSDGIVTNIYVESDYPTKQLELSCHGEHQLTVSANPGVVNLNNDAIITKLDPITATGGQGKLGTDASFKGDYEALAQSLYTFRKNGDGYEVSASAANGTMTWLNVDAGIGSPMSSTAATTKFLANDDGTFFLQSENANYLYFWRNGKNYFDRTTKYTDGFTEGCKFLLYRLANKDEASSKELPGYVPVTQIEDGGQYLIVAQSQGNYFVMRPSTDGNKFAHLLKVDPAKEQTTVTIANVMTFTAQGQAGTFHVLADGTAFEVTVKHQLTRVERVEPTSTTEGNILYWHCDLCGQNFLDEAGTQPVDDVVLPIPLTPLDPSTPVPDEKPDVPVTPDTPTTPDEPSQPDTTPNGNSGTAPADKPAKNPATGDSANLGLWLAVFVLAGAGVGVTVYQKKRKHQS